VVWGIIVAGCGDNIESRLLADEAITSLSGNNVELCALDRTGKLLCWLDPFNNSVPVAKPGAWTSVAAGNTHSCAIDSSGALWCWGRNCVGQLRDGSTGHEEPVRIESDLVWTQVAVGGGKSCALDSEERLHCWGGRDYHQQDCDHATPPIIAVETQRRWMTLSSNWYVVEGVTTAGELIRMLDPEMFEEPWPPLPEVLPGS
jgi:hypothetical protein